MSYRFVFYVPGDSLVHRLDPRSKLVFLALFIASTLFAASLPEAGALLAAAVLLYALARLPFRETKHTWKFVISVALVLSFLNLFALTLLYPRGEHVVLEFWGLRVTQENLLRSLTPVVKLLALATATLTVVFTTPPNLYAPALGQLGLPYKAAYVVELSLRYIPEIVRELGRTLEAQMARGYRPWGGRNPVARILRIVPLIVPVTVSSALSVYDVADAMELRGFGYSKCHTWYRKLELRAVDYVLVAAGILILALVILL